jgi:hypothetical protein
MMNEIASVPIDFPHFLSMGDSGDHLEKRALSATRWSDHGSEVAARKYRGNIGEQRSDFAFLSNGERKIPEFEHDAGLRKPSILTTQKVSRALSSR